MLGSVFSIEATARPGHTAEEIEKAIDEQVAKLRDGGPEANEVERARNVIETRIVQGLENLGGFGGIADRLNTYNHYLSDPGYLPKDIQRYRDVTPATREGVRAGTTGADGSRRRLRSARPAGSRRAGPDAEASEGCGRERARSRSTPTKRGARIRRRPPRRVRFKCRCRNRSCSPNGLTVLVNERPDLPIVSERLVVKTGSGCEPDRQTGPGEFHRGDARRRQREPFGAADRRSRSPSSVARCRRRRRWMRRR